MGGASARKNAASLRTAKQDYAIPPNRSGHRGAFKEVALSVDLHGSFKKVGEASAVAQKNASHTPFVHSKAEPNHYVAPSELQVGFQKYSQGSQGYVKPGPGPTNGLPNSGQQLKQEKRATQVIEFTKWVNYPWVEYFHIKAIWVCAALKGVVLRQLSLG